MKKVLYQLVIFLVMLVFLNCGSVDEFPQLSGEYLGQKVPGGNPEIFAPGIISTGMYERDIAITPDGNEIYFCVTYGNFETSKIMVSKQINGKWTKPETVPFSLNSEYKDVEPFISSNGQKIYFVSDRPSGRENEETNFDIWVADRKENGWGEPYNLGLPINSEGNEFFPSLTKEGTLYYTIRKKGERSDHIYRSGLVEGKYTEPEKLGPEINSGRAEFNAFIAPDESYLIVCVAGREDAVGSIDYYITFRDNNDKWSSPVNLGEKINTTHWQEYSPYVSPDGKYFFFMSTRSNLNSLKKSKNITWSQIQNFDNRPDNGNPDIYWVSALFINELKQK